MKIIICCSLTLVLVSFAGCSTGAKSASLPEQMQPQQVRSIMTRVADWQLEHPSTHNTKHWTYGAFFAGLNAMALMADDDKYTNALLAFGEKNGWQPFNEVSLYHADNHTVGQMYLEMYSRFKEPKMLQGIKDRFDFILANRSNVELHVGKQAGKDRWWWCDALFMAPPIWAKLSKVTGDPIYLEFMNEEWWYTTDYLYDKEEHLYFRDETYFNRREANGKKIFWSRGEGWVLAGLAKVLETMPKDFKDRPRYVKIYKEMATKIVQIQPADGLWRSSLLDPASYPTKETSGSGFFCYALAWGINNRILDEKTYLPAVIKAWTGLIGCVNQDGKLGYVQPIGADPRQVNAEQTDIYGVGAFLLAGSEVHKISVRKGAPD